MNPVCERIDKEAKEAETFTIKIEDQEITVTVEWHLSLDGKLIDSSTGLSKYLQIFQSWQHCVHNKFLDGCNQFFLLDGALCTRCPVTIEEAHNPDLVKDGFDDFWNLETLWQNYDSLKKNPDGSIKITHKGICLKVAKCCFPLHTGCTDIKWTK